MIIHKVKVYPSKIHLPKKNQLAWKIAKIASDNSKLNKETYISFIKTLVISVESKNKLLQLKPSTYIGMAEDLSKN